MKRAAHIMVDSLFLALSLLTIGASILALESRELVYGAVSLAVSLLGIAGLFILLEATFVAMLQVIVFVGAIAVLIIFVVMLVRREKWVALPAGGEVFGGLLIAIAMVAVVGYLALNSGISSTLPPSYAPPSYTQIGVQVLTEYWFALEILGLVLAAAVIGALTMAKIDRNEQ